VSAAFRARKALEVLGWEVGDANLGVNRAIKLVREEAEDQERGLAELERVERLEVLMEQGAFDDDPERPKNMLELITPPWTSGPYPVA